MLIYYSTKGKDFENIEDVDAIEGYVRRCYIGKCESQCSHYHSLSLKALGAFLQCKDEGPTVWVKDIQKLKELSYMQNQRVLSSPLLETTLTGCMEGSIIY